MISEVFPIGREDRLSKALDLAWQTLLERIVSKRVSINKEASLQLHYSSVLLAFGELICTQANETFSIELESHDNGRNIDVTCSLAGTKAAIELKCFRKESNRAADTDMYDVLRDLERLMSYEGFAQKRFICLSDNPYYCEGRHTGHAGSVTIKHGKVYPANTPIAPTWAGKWENKSRDKHLTFSSDVCIEWQRALPWYVLSISL